MTLTLTSEKAKVMTKPHAKNQHYRSSASGHRMETLFIGALKKQKEKEKKKEKE